jgi:hypothetical protein
MFYVEDIQSAAGIYAQRNMRLGSDDPRTIEAHQNLLLAKLFHYIASKLLKDEAPTLRSEQVEVIARLLSEG